MISCEVKEDGFQAKKERALSRLVFCLRHTLLHGYFEHSWCRHGLAATPPSLLSVYGASVSHIVVALYRVLSVYEQRFGHDNNVIRHCR